VKFAVLLQLALAAQRSERREVFQIAPLARTQSEPLLRLALATGLGFSDCLESIESLRRRPRRGAAGQAEMIKRVGKGGGSLFTFAFDDRAKALSLQAQNVWQ